MKTSNKAPERRERSGWWLVAHLMCSVANLVGIQMIRWA
jgi:hypothetical protein